MVNEEEPTGVTVTSTVLREAPPLRKVSSWLGVRVGEQEALREYLSCPASEGEPGCSFPLPSPGLARGDLGRGGSEAEREKNERAVSLHAVREPSRTLDVPAYLSAALRGRCSHSEMRGRRLRTHGIYLRPSASPSRV